MLRLTISVPLLVAFSIISLFSVLSYSALSAGQGSVSQPVTGPRIRDIQGTSHLSPLRDKNVVGVQGIVTVMKSGGFYFEDAQPDNDPRTSEGMFVSSQTGPANVKPGDLVTVDGVVTEFRPGNNAPTNTNLTVTQLKASSVKVLSSGNTLPRAVVIGKGGRVPPNEVIFKGAEGNIETTGNLEPNPNGIDF